MLLKDCATIKGGKRLPKGQTLQGEKNSHPYIRVKDMQKRYVSLSDDYEYVPDNIFPSISRYIVNTGDVILSIVGTVGLVAIVDKSLNNANLTENCVKLVNIKNFLSKYVYYYLISDSGQAQIQAGIVGSTQPKFPLYNIEKIEIPDVSMSEQQHIVDILGTLDDKIENLEEVNSKIQSYCIAKYRLLFSNVERIPLSNISAITMGQSPAGNTLNEKDGVIFYQGRTDFGFRYPTVRLFTTDPKRMANTGDILLSVRAPVGDVNIAAEDCCIGRGIAAISSEYNSFVYYSILNQKSDFDIYNNSGTIFGSINRDALSAFKIPAANIALIEKFESVASEMDKVIHNNTLKIYKLRALKQVYLHKFFG